MRKHGNGVVGIAAEHVFTLFRSAPRDGALVFHSYDRSRELARACKEIAKGCDLDAEQTRIALLAAWFHDAGYAAGPHTDGVESAAIARQFLAENGQPAELADAVEACMRAAGDGVLENAAQEVLHDALLVSTANKRYVRELALLRLENERRGDVAVSDIEWTESHIRYLDQHPFRTRYAQIEYNRGRAENLVRLHNLLREQREQAAAQRADDDKVEKGLGKRVEGLYSDIIRNELRLLAIADRRTSTMVHVNAIMISLVVALLLRHIEAHRHLLVPTLLLLAVNLLAVLISILSMRVGRSVRDVLGEDANGHDGNLLAITNRLPMSRDEYYERMENLTRDVPALRKAMIEATFYIRRILNWRARMLRLTYDVFLGGLVISVFVFVVAVLRK
jgi:predicted metal-dependent HD superfamily phosphohydrolase